MEPRILKSIEDDSNHRHQSMKNPFVNIKIVKSIANTLYAKNVTAGTIWCYQCLSQSAARRPNWLLLHCAIVHEIGVYVCPSCKVAVKKENELFCHIARNHESVEVPRKGRFLPSYKPQAMAKMLVQCFGCAGGRLGLEMESNMQNPEDAPNQTHESGTSRDEAATIVEYKSPSPTAAHEHTIEAGSVPNPLKEPVFEQDIAAILDSMLARWQRIPHCEMSSLTDYAASPEDDSTPEHLQDIAAPTKRDLVEEPSAVDPLLTSITSTLNDWTTTPQPINGTETVPTSSQVNDAFAFVEPSVVCSILPTATPASTEFATLQADSLAEVQLASWPSAVAPMQIPSAITPSQTPALFGSSSQFRSFPAPNPFLTAPTPMDHGPTFSSASNQIANISPMFSAPLVEIGPTPQIDQYWNQLRGKFMGGTLYCSLCGTNVTADTKLMPIKHVLTTHMGTDFYKCQIYNCPKTCDTKVEMEDHLRQHYPNIHRLVIKSYYQDCANRDGQIAEVMASCFKPNAHDSTQNMAAHHHRSATDFLMFPPAHPYFPPPHGQCASSLAPMNSRSATPPALTSAIFPSTNQFRSFPIVQFPLQAPRSHPIGQAPFSSGYGPIDSPSNQVTSPTVRPIHESSMMHPTLGSDPLSDQEAKNLWLMLESRLVDRRLECFKCGVDIVVKQSNGHVNKAFLIRHACRHADIPVSPCLLCGGTFYWISKVEHMSLFHREVLSSKCPVNRNAHVDVYRRAIMESVRQCFLPESALLQICDD